MEIPFGLSNAPGTFPRLKIALGGMDLRVLEVNYRLCQSANMSVIMRNATASGNPRFPACC